MISYGRQFIDNDDIKSVISVLKSDYLTQGPVVKKFEKQINNLFGSKYSLATSNGTAALYLAGKAIGWNNKSHIIASPLTFVAGANVAELFGASVKFIDINPTTYCIDTNALEKYLKNSRKKITSIIATDFAGHVCDWKKLKHLSKKYNFTLINDNCHATGAEYFGSYKYAVKYADICCSSFHPVKHFTTGEGGAIFTNKQNFYKKLLIFREHGILKKKNWWDHDVVEPSLNFRMSELQAALGISQIKKIFKFLKYRRKIAKIYDTKLNNIDMLKIPEKINCNHSYHLYPVLIDFKKLKKTKKSLFQIFLKNDIKLQVHYKPTHLFSYYQKKYKNKKIVLKNSEKFYQQELSLPIFFNLKKDIVNKVIQILKDFTVR